LWLAVMAEWLVTARNHSRHHVAMASN
jgi:hypothetical protein